MPRHGQLLFQDPATRFLEFAVNFHHDVMLIMLCFFCLVLWFIIRINLVFKNNTYQNPRYRKILNNKMVFLPNIRTLTFRRPIAYKSYNILLEIVWTLIPALILVSIAIPSFNLLYFNQWETNATYTVRVTASQWFWSYAYPLQFNYNIEKKILNERGAIEYRRGDSPLYWKGRFTPRFIDSMNHVNELNLKIRATSYGKIFYTVCADLLKISSKSIELSFDSTLIPLDIGKRFRLLEVDNELILPRNTHIKFVVTSNDVLHSWSIPSLGIKIDACPGRLNEVSTVIYRNSVFYGQCSEICGVLHGFMPIVIQTVNYLDFLKLKYLLIIHSHY